MIPKHTPIFLMVCVLVMSSGLVLLSWRLPARLRTPPTSSCNITTRSCYSIRNRPSRNTTYPALLVAHNIMGIPADITHSSRGSQDANVSKKGSSGNENVTGIALGYAKTKWPVFSRNFESILKIPESHYHPGYLIKWDFDSSRLLQREDVRSTPPKVITWMAKTRYMPSLPEPVRLRFCPEMPCRLTTNLTYAAHGAALLWNAPNLNAAAPPPRENADQVYIFHNQERQTPEQTRLSTFHRQTWKSAFNWTMTYRFDSDIMAPYGLVVKRPTPLVKNYTAVLANKTRLVSWLVSHCETHGEREAYVRLLERHLPVHKYGECGSFRCARSEDDVCLQRVTSTYKFFLAFENALCKDYITEKIFRYYNADVVVVVRGSDDYQHLAPPDTYINTADFRSAKELADYLLYLDSHPEEYIKILKAKDEYVALYEDYTHIMGSTYVHYHYEAIPYCEMCRRLWDLDRYRKVITDIEAWFDKGNCYPPNDLT